MEYRADDVPLASGCVLSLDVVLAGIVHVRSSFPAPVNPHLPERISGHDCKTRHPRSLCHRLIGGTTLDLRDAYRTLRLCRPYIDSLRSFARHSTVQPLFLSRLHGTDMIQFASLTRLLSNRVCCPLLGSSQSSFFKDIHPRRNVL